MTALNDCPAMEITSDTHKIISPKSGAGARRVF